MYSASSAHGRQKISFASLAFYSIPLLFIVLFIIRNWLWIDVLAVDRVKFTVRYLLLHFCVNVFYILQLNRVNTFRRLDLLEQFLDHYGHCECV